jgi:probable HAF family extracellular repeat protein
MAFQAARLLFVGIALLIAQTALAQPYTVTDLGTFDGIYSEAWAINGLGQVVGQASVAGETHAFVWTGGTMQDLGTLPDTDSCTAVAINDSGQVVGWCANDEQQGFVQAFLWTADDGMSPLPIAARTVEARGINGQGHIVGLQSDGLVARAFVYRDGQVDDLGPMRANAINDQDQIVGNGNQTARVWDITGARDLDSEGGLSRANAISSAGLAAGASTRGGAPPSPLHAVLWTPYGVSDLGTLGGANAEALATNGDIVVGWSNTAASADAHAFVYDTNGPGDPVDLNDRLPPGSVWTLVVATGINAAGQIVGYGTVYGATHAFLLTPVDATRQTGSQGPSTREP